MKNFIIARLIPILLVFAGLGLLFDWIISAKEIQLTKRLAGADNAPVKTSQDDSPVEFVGHFVAGPGKVIEIDGSWPRFRGEGFDGVSMPEVALATRWPKGGPRELWSVEMGEGHGGAAVHNGRVYVLDYDRQTQADAIRCLSLDDGREIWRYWYPVKIKRNHGMSRTVPAVTDKYIVTLGPKCHVVCLDAISGEFFWTLDLVREFGTEVPLWYAGQCPLIDNDRAIIAPGGKTLMMAVDCQTGEILWETPNPDDWKMTHSSIIPMTLGDKRFFVYCGSGGVVGVSAADGSVLWKNTDWKMRTNIATPVVAGQGRLFLSAGYRKGAMMLELVEKDGRIETEILFRLEPEIFGAEQQTPIFYNGYIYGVRPDEQLVCLDMDGKVLWSSGSDHKFGIGPYLIAQGLIYVMDDHGLLTLARAQPDKYVQFGQAKVLEGPDSWGPMAIVSSRLILRDLNRMVCLDIAKP